jgi:plasmid stability protein
MHILASGVSVSLAIGIGLVWYAGQPEETPQQVAAGSAQARQAETTGTKENYPTGLNQFASLWGKAGAESSVPQQKSEIVDDLLKRSITPADKLKPGDDAQDKLRKLALADPAVMKNLLARYGREIDPNTREVLRAVLSTIDKPEVLAFTKELATSGDAEQRREGLAMLQNFSTDSQEVRDVLKQTLATEQTPSVLVQAMKALKPAAVQPAESQAIVAQLQTLTQNPDPAVRSQSVLDLAQWDKTGAAQGSLSQALADQSPEVRQAAIFAVAQAGMQSDSTKAALLNMAANVNENKEVRGSALQVLEQFKLNQNEMATLNQARSSVLGM